MKFILILLTCCLAFSSSALAQVAMLWSSQVVVPGEKTLLVAIMTNGDMVEPEPLGRIPGASVRYAGCNYISWPTAPNKTAFYVAFEVVADKTGTVSIPSISLKGRNGTKYHTSQQELKVLPYDSIKWASSGQFQFGTLWYVSDSTPYLHQAVPSELKFYLPPTVTEYQLPTVETDGLAAWRFEPGTRDRSIFNFGSALIRGYDWKVVAFQSVLTPLRSGPTSIKGSITMYVLDSNDDARLAQFIRNYVPVTANMPELTINAKPLPAGAPKTFSNAVGQFSLKATTDATSLSANEPISVQLEVSGTGNIDTITSPSIENDGRWKLYPSNKLKAPDERTLTGTVTFQQLLRPTAETDAIPPFVFTYFDPSTCKYETVRSNPIPLPWKSTAPAVSNFTPEAVSTPPPAGIVPVEEMRDIYGIVPLEAVSNLSQRTNWLWYLTAYIPALAAVCFLIFRWWHRRQELSQANKERWNAFTAIRTDEETNQFLRSLGGFIEAYIPADRQTPDIQRILQTRDELAFIPDPAENSLTKQEKQSMLKVVKSILKQLPVILISLLLPLVACDTACAGDDAQNGQDATSLYERGEYSQAAKIFSANLSQSNQSPQQLAYNYFGLGNSLYRLDKVGEAALAYRRALALCPDFIEASRNLGFIERKEGAILPRIDSSYAWMTSLRYSQYLTIALISGAILALMLLSLLIIKKHKLLISFAVSLSLIALVMALVCRHLYPLLPENVEGNTLLVVTEKTPALLSADLSGKPIMTLPASTPLILEAKRGSWYYAKTFSGTPAWIQANHAQLLSPKE